MYADDLTILARAPTLDACHSQLNAAPERLYELSVAWRRAVTGRQKCGVYAVGNSKAVRDCTNYYVMCIMVQFLVGTFGR